jgi:hypothetical protein
LSELNLLWVAYGSGILGMLMEWRAYTLHCGRAFRRWSAAGALLWAAQYLLLGAWTAAFTMGTTALRTMFSGSLKQPLRKHAAAVGFVLLFAGITAITWQGPVSLLPAFAVINTTLALFYLNNRWMRVALLVSGASWIANDIFWQAWPALVSECVATVLNIRTILRLSRPHSEASLCKGNPPI